MKSAVQKNGQVSKEEPLDGDEKNISKEKLDSEILLVECYICQKVFSQKSNLKVHISSIHEGKKPFKCSICDYKCSQKGHLYKHISSVHEVIKPFKCPICGFKFSLKRYWTRHIVSVHEMN